MVAIITGKGAGIENSSVALLGSRGQLGGSALGRSGESVFLNAATGNLVINDTDEMLVGRGPDAVVSRTYNSLGAWDGDNDDYWRAGVYRRVFGLTGGSGYGTTGSTVKRTDWDGSDVTYTWSSTESAYVATDGAGAYDTLTRTSTTWTWTDGNSRITEAYDDSNSGRITSRRDTSGNAVTYTYTGSLITRITTSGGEYTDLTYSGTQLTSLVTNAGGQITRTYYEYDGSDRLVKVLVNLAPSDNSKSTGTNYETTYTYDGASQRVASITQSDGTLVAFGYTQVGADYRVTSITQTVASGVTRLTTISYDTTNKVTSITDPAGQVTRLTYDANGNLTKIVTPPVGAELAPQVMEFGYEADGDVASVRLGPGNTITYEYDTRGNIILERDAAGNTIARTYSAKNELLTQTKYLKPDLDGAGSGPPDDAVVTNYIYDTLNRLRYSITPEGRVTEYRYDGFGQQTSRIQYTASTYTSTMTLASLNSWVSGTASRVNAQRTDTWYDFRGNVSRTVSYATLNEYGEGTQDPATIVAASNSTVTVTPQPDGLYQIEKTSGADSAWNSDAHSMIKAEGDFVLQVRAGQTNRFAVAGVATSPGSSSSFDNLNFGFNFRDGGALFAVEGGSITDLATTYTTTDNLWLVRVGSTITYYKGATLSAAITAGSLRTQTSSAVLYFDASLYTGGSSLAANFTPQPIVNGVNTTIAQQIDGMTRITKSGGTNGTYDADARGSAAATGDFVLQLRPGQANAELVAGVSTSPGTNSSTANVNYGIAFSNAGVAQYWLGATSGYGSLGSYTANQSFWLVRTGTTLNYYQGATLEEALRGGTLHTVTGVNSTLYFDSALRVNSSKIDVAFTPGALSSPEVTRTDYVYNAAGQLLSRAIAGQGAESFVYDGMGRITSSTDMGGVATTIAFNDTTSSTVVTLANGLIQTSTYNKAGELITYAESGTGVTTATTSYTYDGLGRLRYVTDPTGQSSFYFHDAIGRRVAEIDADGSVTEYRYDANNNLTSTTAYSGKLSAAQLASLKSDASPIVVGANTSVVQQSDGLYRITKTTGSDGWNADARGTLAMAGDFLLQVKPTQNTQPLSSGVSLAPGTSSSYTDVRYGFTLDYGYVYAFEYDAVAGTSSQTHLGVTYAAGDNLWMTRVGSTIRWYKGATFEAAQAAGALRTVTGANTGTMYFDSSVYTTGSSMDVGLTTLPPVLASIRPATDSANDRWTFNVYDQAQRLIQTIDGTGATTVHSYDGASRLTSTRSYEHLVSSTDLATLKARAIAPNVWANPNDASLWEQAGATRAAAGSIDGSNAYKFTINTSGTIVWLRPATASVDVKAGDTVTFTFWMKADTVDHLGFGLRGTVSTWGSASETSARILSGPGSISGTVGSRTITGLSTTEPTLVSISRTFTQAESVMLVINPSYPNTNTVSGDSVIVAKPIATFTPASAAYLPTTPGDDRVSRLFYDNDGNLVGTLDAEGYLTEIIYDGAGRKVRTIAYSAGTGGSGTLPSGMTLAQLRAGGTFAELKANITPSSTSDIYNWSVYDARGLLRATIDGEGSLTRYDYTPAGYLSQQISGQKLTVSTWITTPPTLATLPAAGGSDILSTTAWTYSLHGQVLSETRALTGSATTTTTYSYDNMRRLIATTTQAGGTDPRTYHKIYDLIGNLRSELSGDGYAALSEPMPPTMEQAIDYYGWRYTYDANGRLTSKTGPRGTAAGAVAPRTFYYYTPDGSLAFEVSSYATTDGTSTPFNPIVLGEVTEYRYNAFGERVDAVVYATRLPAAVFATLAGGDAATVSGTIDDYLSATLDTVIHTDFNVDGTVKRSVDALGRAIDFEYNAFGELKSSSADLDNNGLSGAARDIVTQFTYDRRGLLKQEKVDPSALNITTSYGYDAFGRALTLTNVLPGDDRVTTSTYDRKGRLITTSQSPDGGTTVYETTYTYDARDNLVAVEDALHNVTRYVYDKANRKVATIDALGGLTTTSYDADGRVVATRAYKNTVSISTGTLEIAETNSTLTAAIANTNAADHVSRYAYDKDGQLRFTVDGLMHVVEHAYDASGNAIRTIAYDGTIGTDGTGAYSATFIAGQISTLNLASAAGTRITRAVYDASGQLTYSIDAMGNVTRIFYDAKGQVIRQIEFAASYSTSGDPDLKTMAAWVAAYANATDDRTTRAYYDPKGQLAFSIDALGYVTRVEYDKLGNVTKQTRYATLPASDSPSLGINDTTSLANLTSHYTATPSSARETLFAYDSAGRLIATTDPAGFITKLELDAMGQITSSTAAFGVSGQASTTAYTYDDVGRVVKQVSASGETEATTSWFFYDAVGQQTAAIDGENYLTVWTYDAVGNRLTEKHYADQLLVADTFDATTNVEALIEYADDAPSDDIATSATYDAFGRAVITTDARGNHTYSYYDKLGRQIATRDVEDYVTETSYTAFGQIADVIRHSAKATNTVSTTLPGSWTWASADSPAITSFEYDKRGLLTKSLDAEVIVGGSPVRYYEQYTLNAFGERTEVRNRLGGITTYLYDKRGAVLTETLPTEVQTIAAIGGGSIAIVNRFKYDAFGSLEKKTEAEGAVEERVTDYEYDKLGRQTKILEEQVTVTTVTSSSVTTSTERPTTYIYYDALGNVIQTTAPDDAKTFFRYDHLGRKTFEISPVGTLSAYTYDANGNLKTVKVYADAVALPTTPGGSFTPPGGTYRLTSYAYDASNRLIKTTVSGLQTGEWNGSAWVFATSDIETRIEYDKAGNVVHQEDGRGNDTWIWYDKLGREVAKVDAENYLTRWTRDAEGNATEETRYATALSSFSTGGTPPTQTAHDNDRTTEFSYDKMGRRTEERRLKVAHTSIAANGVATDVLASDSSAISKVSYTYNGLGQVLTKTEANLADIAVSTTARETTSYSYDKIGRLVLETGQSFTDFDGGDLAVPITAFVYDGLNNLVSSRVQAGSVANDTNDRITTYTYGAGGRLASVTDAATFTRSYDYDRSGRTVMERYTRTKADGSTTVKEAQVTRYDLAGRVILQTMARDSGTSTPSWGYTSELTGNPAYDATHIRYNAYGEMTGRGITAATTPAVSTPVYQEEFYYDAGGRLWKSNAGDGVLRFYVYDKAGNQTLTLTSAGADLSSLTASNYTGSISNGVSGTGDTSTANAVTTITVYDKRGQATSTREPDRALSSTSTSSLITRSRTYNAFGEVVSETDPRGYDASGNAITFSGGAGYTTTFTYNSMGRMLSKVSPQVSMTSENGTISNVNPTETYGYDLAGRLVSVMDANANAISNPLDRYRTTRLLLAGTGHDGTDPLVTKEFHADSGVFETKYNTFGDAVILRNELNIDETRTYDELGRVSTVVHRGGELTDTYSYDVLGQRTKAVQSWTIGITNYSLTTSTDYDVKGRVTDVTDAAGDITTFRYAWNDTKVTSGLGTFGGWVKTTNNVGASKDMVETSDYFGRVIDREDFGNNAIAFTFDKAGRLDTQIASGLGQSLDYGWYNTGQLASVNDQSSVNIDASYEYDLNGQRLVEHLQVGSSGTIYQHSVVVRDALGRMTSLDETGDNGTVTIDINYDAAGNIRRNLSTHYKLSDAGSLTGTLQTDDKWYSYDQMNRVVIGGGGFTGTAGSGTINAGGGQVITYDVAGRRATASYYAGITQRVWKFTPNAGPVKFYAEPNFEWDHGSWLEVDHTVTGIRREEYTYTADGELLTVKHADPQFVFASGTISLGSSGTSRLRAAYQRDDLGRVTNYKEYKADGTTVQYERYDIAYDGAGRVTEEKTSLTRTEYTPYATTVTYVTEIDNSYSLGGLLTGSTAKLIKNGNDGAMADTANSYTYLWRDSALQATIGYTPDVGAPGTVWTTTHTYDANSHLASSGIVDGRPRTVSFVTDLAGQVLVRDEEDGNTGMGDPRTLTYFFEGHQVGTSSNNGVNSNDAGPDGFYETALYDRVRTGPLPQYSGPFRFDEATGWASGNFDQGYQPINPSNPGNSGSYTVGQGDTLAGIAQSAWGDSSLWYLVAQANGLSPSSALIPGQRLNLPAGVSNGNNSSTFRPYDPSIALGDLSPTTSPLPKAANGPKCGMIGMILMVAISVAVAAWIGPGAIGFFQGALGMAAGATGSAAAIGGAVIGGAVAGAAGSIASQAFGLATGIQTGGFDWKGVGLAAIGGGVGAGLGQVAKAATAVSAAAKGASKFGQALRSVGQFVGQGRVAGDVIRGVLGSAMTQGIGVATGLQKEFSWAGVAGAGVGAAASGWIDIRGAKAMANGTESLSGVVNIVSGMAGGIANATIRTISTGSTFGDNLIAALPDVIGGTLGRVAAKGIISATRQRGPQAIVDFKHSDGVDMMGPGLEATSYIHGLIVDPTGMRDRFTPEGWEAYQNATVALDVQSIDADGDLVITPTEISSARSRIMDRETVIEQAAARERITAFDLAHPPTSTESKAGKTVAVGEIGEVETVPGGNPFGYISKNSGSKDLGQGLVDNWGGTNPKTFADLLIANNSYFQLQGIVRPLEFASEGQDWVREVYDHVRGHLDELNKRAFNAVDRPILLYLGGTTMLAGGAAFTPLAAAWGGSLSFGGTGSAVASGGAGFVTGGGFGVGFEFIKNESFGLNHELGGYTSAFVSGGMGGTGLRLVPTRFLSNWWGQAANRGLMGTFSGVTGEGAGQLVTTGGDFGKIDNGKLLLQGGMGGLIGAVIPDFRKSGWTTGRNNSAAIYAGLQTRLSSGNIGQFQVRYSVNGGVASAMKGLNSQGAGSLFDGSIKRVWGQ